MNKNAILRGTLALVLGLAMVIAPTVQLARHDARFGWRMFSFASALPSFTIVAEDGSERPADAARHIAVRRGDVPFADVLPPLLCDLHQDAAKIVVTLGGEETVFLCS